MTVASPPATNQADPAATATPPAATPEKPAAETPQPAATPAATGTLLGNAKPIVGKPAAQSSDPGKPPEPAVELKAPEGNQLFDPQAVSAFAEVTRAAKLDPAQAQKLLDSTATALQDRLAARHAERVQAWAEESKNDPEIGGAKLDTIVGRARAAIDKVAPELLPLLNETGFGNRREVLLAFARVADLILEDEVITPTSPATVPEKTIAQRLFES